MLANLDCIVIDLQDVGVRCYTYVSCMRYAMEACFEAGVEVIVLDRPNPLGGLKIAGPMIDSEWISYVGAFPMPFVHGMTIAELALWSKQTPGVLKIEEKVQKREAYFNTDAEVGKKYDLAFHGIKMVSHFSKYPYA